jgi:hypothetical protein
MNVYKTLTSDSTSSRRNAASDEGSNNTMIGVSPVRRCLCHGHSSGIRYHVNYDDDNHDDDDDDEILMGDSTPRCSVCIRQILQPYLLRHERALIDHIEAKIECQRRLRQIPDTHKLTGLQAESQHLRDRLNYLRQVCGDVAVRIAGQAVENDTHREQTGQYHDAARQRQTLHGLEESLLEGSLTQAINSSTQQVRVLRFQWALKVLSMYRLYIDPEDIKPTPLQQKRHRQQQKQNEGKTATTSAASNSTSPGTATDPSEGSASPQHLSMNQQRTTARGIAKIAGLPLPNAGPELYGVLPPSELVSALRLVASCTHTLARTLGIVLPHPIFLTMNSNNSHGSRSSSSSHCGPSGAGTTNGHLRHGGGGGDITDLVSDDELRRYRNEQFGKHDDSPPFDSLDGTLSANNQQRTDRYLSNPFSNITSSTSLEMEVDHPVHPTVRHLHLHSCH